MTTPRFLRSAFTTTSVARRCGRLPGPALARLTAGTLAHLEPHRREQVQTVARYVTAALGEPLAAARRIAAASLDGNTTFYAHAEWLSRQPAARRRRHVDRLTFPDEPDLKRLLNTAPARPLMIVSAHMCGYLDALLRLCAAIPPDRPMAMIRREPASARDQMFTDMRSGPDPLILRSYERPGLPALGVLRACGVLLVMLDVPGSLDPGVTTPVNLLDMPARLPAGPVELAVRADALILPVFSSSDGITCLPLLDAAGPRGERNTRRHRLQQQLAAALGAAIRSAPADWLLWAHLPAFLNQTGPHPAPGTLDMPR